MFFLNFVIQDVPTLIYGTKEQKLCITLPFSENMRLWEIGICLEFNINEVDQCVYRATGKMEKKQSL